MYEQPAAARAQIDLAYTWNVSSIFPNEDRWEEAYKQVEAALAELDALRGSLGVTADGLLHTLRLHDTVAAGVDRLLLYADLRRDEDASLAEPQARAERATQLQAHFGAISAFVRPEIRALPEPTVTQFLRDLPELRTYEFFFNDLRRQHAHIQSAEVEAVLAQARMLTEMPLGLFGAIKDADFVAPVIQGAMAVTHGRYWALLRGAERPVRREAYFAYTAQFLARQHALAAALASAIKRDVFLARARQYPSALQAALDADAIPIAVYDQMIGTVRQHLPLLQRYLQLRRRVLCIDTLTFYDLWTPLASAAPSIEYDSARLKLLDALAPLGDEYGAMLKHGLFEGRWVDVYETAHKRSGAYSAGAFGTPPFILLNWQHQLSDLYALAHEAGHAMHTYFAAAHQPYVYSHYSIFVAEVASTCNEVLLSEHLLATAATHGERLYVLSQQLQRIVELLFWQALFAEFDRVAHAQAEAGHALTAAWFSDTIARLQRTYYGDTVALDDRASLLWALFPHFYLNFYVYKFATGMAAALALAGQIRADGSPAVERYLAFLRSGSSKSAVDVLRAAGIDMTTAKPIEQAMHVFASLLDRFEDLVNQGTYS